MKQFIINEKKYFASSGYSPIKLFASKKSLEFHEVFEYLGSLDFEKTTNKLLDDFSLLLWCFIERGCEIEKVENDLVLNDCIDYIGQTKCVPEIVDLLYRSFGVELKDKKEDKKEKKNQ